MKKMAASILLVFGLAIVLNSCKKDDPPLPPNNINFQAAEIGLGASETEATVTLTLSREADEATSVTIGLEPSGVIYGTDFTTNPEASASGISLSVPAGSNTVSFKVTKKPELLLSGGETIKFSIAEAGTLAIGSVKEATLSFATIVSEGGSSFVFPGKITGSAPGSNYANMVFIDLSNNAVVAADRKSWNLGFKSGSDFRVVLNHAYQSVAGVTTKTDITQVTEADADDIELNFAPGDGSLDNVDDWTGDLTKTAIAEISANDNENKVYLLASESTRATKSDWLKVKITRNGDGYKVQYAKIGETAIKTLEVPKKEDYNFTFVSLENNTIVDVEPKAASWDIQWGYSTYNSGLNTPYWFQDFIILNYIGGAQAAEVVVFEADGTTPAVEATTITRFNAFAESDLAGLTFLSTRDAVAGKWRSTIGSGIKRDRFYVIKDPSGNIYKLRFLKMGVGDTGERGRPEIEFKLVKKGS
ncbi:MAG TPA: HmuY family protein [Flavitalea sp.]|nr:HmuY family protein [Flavitalea sp.]